MNQQYCHVIVIAHHSNGNTEKKRRDLLPNSKIWPTRVCAYPPIYEGTYTDISSSGYMWDTIWAVPLSAENIEKII